MRTQKSRARRLECKTPTVERKFIGWPMNPWTPEQAAEAIRRHPEQTVFWRSAYERKEDTAGKMRYPNEDMTGVFATDWRARAALVHGSRWGKFIIEKTRGTRRVRSGLFFQVVVAPAKNPKET